MAAKRSRYLGVQPFKTSDRQIFFGRDEDIENLLDFIMLEKLIVLFGKSGYGKSSLLSAGIVPRLTDSVLPVELRFGPYTAGRSFSPLETARRFLQDIPASPDLDFLENLTDGDSLWLHVKQRQAAANGQFVLIFDQFEEFFSYPSEQQETFRRQVSELIYSDIPQTVRTRLDTLSEAERSLIVRPLQVRVVFSIRNDRLSLLDSMKDALPAILHKRYELRALTPTQAREAIVQPARLPQSTRFLSPAFAYTQEALDAILKALTTARTDDGQQTAAAGIEAFQLQIVCEYLEGLVRNAKAPMIDGVPTITEADLPELDSLYENYYHRKLAELPVDLRRPAELLLEEGLLAEDPVTGEGRRMSVDSRALNTPPELLEQLEKTYLIRREVNTVGGFSFEISHDTLVAPIQKAKAERRVVEEQERLYLEAEAREAQLTEERRKRRRANLIAAVGFLLFSLAAIAAFWAWRQTQVAREYSDKARQEKENAENNAREALHQKTVADSLTEVAKTERKKALAAITEVAWRTVNEAKLMIYHMDYEQALISLKYAAELDVIPLVVSDSMLEIVYFFAETGQMNRAKGVLDTAARLSGKDPSSFKRLKTRADFYKAIVKINSAIANTLRERYYPVMLPIPGGTDTLGFEKNYAVANLPSFMMAKTETTWWQYNLYCIASGKPIPEKRHDWESEGDNPAVNISWYGAVEYANWVSTRLGKVPFYHIEEDETDPNNRNDADSIKWLVEPVHGAKGYRLPTEIEWEYAARSGKNTLYAGSDSMDLVGWYDANSSNRTHPVATKKPNSFGLYDMSGNVWEWCWDWWMRFYPPHVSRDYKGPDQGKNPIVRGCSWASALTPWASVSFRLDSYSRSDVDTNLGFRLVL